MAGEAASIAAMKAPETRLLIGGEQVEGDGEPLEVENPATEEEIATVATASDEQIEAAIAARREAQRGWERTPAVERAELLHEVAATASRPRGRARRADDARGRQARGRELRRGRLDGGGIRLLRRDRP